MKLKYRKKSTKTGKNFRGGGKNFSGWPEYTPLSWCQFAEGSKCLSKCFVGRVDQVEEAVLIHLISAPIERN